MQENRLEPEEPRRMLIPQYSLRWLLGAITAAACVFSIVAVGVRGQPWALAVSIGLLAIVISGLVYAAAFGVVWLFAVVTSRSGGQSPEDSPFGSPFAGPPLEAGTVTSVEDIVAKP
jgi:hypothetical protein